MEAGPPWVCAACGAGNAGYRRRCVECGARRPAGAFEAAQAAIDPAPGGPIAVGDIPMPRLARRPAPLSRGPLLVLAAAVLALAAFGLVTYLGSGDPPDDELLAAALGPDAEPVDPAAGVLDARCDDGLAGATAQARRQDPTGVVALLAFEDAGAAADASVVLGSCPAGRHVLDGRLVALSTSPEVDGAELARLAVAVHLDD